MQVPPTDFNGFLANNPDTDDRGFISSKFNTFVGVSNTLDRAKGGAAAKPAPAATPAPAAAGGGKGSTGLTVMFGTEYGFSKASFSRGVGVWLAPLAPSNESSPRRRLPRSWSPSSRPRGSGPACWTCRTTPMVWT